MTSRLEDATDRIRADLHVPTGVLGKLGGNAAFAPGAMRLAQGNHLFPDSWCGLLGLVRC